MSAFCTSLVNLPAPEGAFKVTQQVEDSVNTGSVPLSDSH